MQSGGKAVVPARGTAAAGLLDQEFLDVATPLGDPFLSAQNTAVGAAGVESEDSSHVAATYAHDLPRRGCGIHSGQP
jgi:hypothetical protein